MVPLAFLQRCAPTVNGWITLTEKPGLGLELDEDEVNEYKVA